MDNTERDQLIMQWQQADKAAKAAVARERELRTEVFNKLFPQAKVGTNNLELGMGYKLKAVNKINYNMAGNDAVDAALEEMAKLGNEGSFIADRVVGWTPKLMLKEYKELAPEYKAIIDKVVTTSPGLPTLEVVEPAAKA